MAEAARPKRNALRTRNQQNRLIGLVAASCAAVVLAACSSDTEPSDSRTSSAPAVPSKSPSASTNPTEAAAIAAYKAYWQEMEKLYADRTGKSANLDQYAASAALKNAEADAESTHQRGLINTGNVAVTNPTVTKVDTSGKIANVTVSSCLDISRWRTLDAGTKKPVALPDNRLTQYLIVSTVEKYPEGWRVTRDEPQGKKC